MLLEHPLSFSTSFHLSHHCHLLVGLQQHDHSRLPVSFVVVSLRVFAFLTICEILNLSTSRTPWLAVGKQPVVQLLSSKSTFHNTHAPRATSNSPSCILHSSSAVALLNTTSLENLKESRRGRSSPLTSWRSTCSHSKWPTDLKRHGRRTSTIL